MILKRVRGILKFALDFLFPIQCVGCGRIGAWLCSECLIKIPLKTYQHCPKCFNINKDSRLCLKCNHKYPINRLWVATNYSNRTITKLIKGLKYRFAYELARPLSQILFKFLKEQKLRLERDYPKFSNYIIIPVPIHKKRLNWRGFNQAELIANFLADKLKLPVETSLKKIKNNQPQAELKGKTNRLLNLKNSYQWQGESLKNKKIILIDDIRTTGATLEECAYKLKKAGAKHIFAIVIANG